jgi:hypothetical protein
MIQVFLGIFLFQLLKLRFVNRCEVWKIFRTCPEGVLACGSCVGLLAAARRILFKVGPHCAFCGEHTRSRLP